MVAHHCFAHFLLHGSSDPLLNRNAHHQQIHPLRPIQTRHHHTCSDIPPTLTHLTSHGTAHMVAIHNKPITTRTAVAIATLTFSNDQPYTALATSTLKKGDALAVARIAGIQAVKRTADLIPLAHPGLGVTGVEIDVDLVTPSASATKETGAESPYGAVHLRCSVTCTGRTGVEMEALCGVSVAALTMFDMCKGLDKRMVIGDVKVIKKSGGRSGDWELEDLRGGELG